MGATRHRRATIIAVLSIVIVLVSGSLAFATGNSGPEVPDDGGILILETGFKNRFIYREQGSADQIQTIKSNRCVASLTGADLVSLSSGPDGSKPSFFWAGLAVKSNTGNCSTVDPGEHLSIALSDGIDGLIEYAELDIEAKAGTEILAELYRGGNKIGEQVLSTADGAAGNPAVHMYWYHYSNNYRFTVEGDTPFDTLVLSVATEAGWFRLEGGSDHKTDVSFFRIIKGEILECGESLETGQEGPDAIVTLIQTDDCVAQLVVFRSGVDENGQFISLEKNEGATGTFTMSSAWNPEPSTMPVPATLIDFGDGHVPMELCGGTAEEPELPPSGAEWCVSSQYTEPAGNGLMQVIETYFGEGDPGFLRN